MLAGYRAWAVLAWLCALAPAASLAHGLLVRIDPEPASITGVAYYTNGEIAAGQWVEVVDITEGSAPVGNETDAEGRFRFPGVIGHRYRVIAHGDEGHRTELEIVLGSDETPRLVDEDGEATSPYWPPPAWAVIGALLLLSLIPAALSARRRRTRS